MDTERILLNSLYPPKNSCKDLLDRFYYSKYVQLLYIILIILCIFELFWAITHFSDYPYDIWTTLMDLVLTSVILIDSIFRCYLYGFKDFCNCKNNWIEIIVVCLGVPEIGLLLVYIFITQELGSEQEIASIVFQATVVIIRPIVFCKRQKKSNVQSVHLPGSVVSPDNEEAKNSPERIDSVDGDFPSVINRNSIAVRNSYS